MDSAVLILFFFSFLFYYGKPPRKASEARKDPVDYSYSPPPARSPNLVRGSADRLKFHASLHASAGDAAVVHTNPRSSHRTSSIIRGFFSLFVFFYSFSVACFAALMCNAPLPGRGSAISRHHHAVQQPCLDDFTIAPKSLRQTKMRIPRMGLTEAVSFLFHSCGFAAGVPPPVSRAGGR